jgi:hypothetical protein
VTLFINVGGEIILRKFSRINYACLVTMFSFICIWRKHVHDKNSHCIDVQEGEIAMLVIVIFKQILAINHQIKSTQSTVPACSLSLTTHFKTNLGRYQIPIGKVVQKLERYLWSRTN